MFRNPGLPKLSSSGGRHVVQQSALAALAAATTPTIPVHPRIDVSRSVAKQCSEFGVQLRVVAQYDRYGDESGVSH